MKRWALSFQILILLSAVCLLGQQARTESTPPIRVLALYWYGRDTQSNIAFDQGIRKVFQNHRGPIEYYVEYLETERFPGEQQAGLFHNYLRQKYANRMIDVVIADTDVTLNFLLKYRKEGFSGVPIVYFSLRSNEASGRPGPGREDGLTGVVASTTCSGTIDLALKAQPETKRVYVIVGGSPELAKDLESVARSELKPFENSVEIDYLTSLPTTDLMSRLKTIPEDSVILYMRQSDESRGLALRPLEMLDMIAHEASVPIYGIANAYVGRGIVGGNLINHEGVGSQVAEIALKVASGARILDIPIEEAKLKPTFDWRQLRRWGISEDSLPPGSEVRFRELTFWERYKGRIVGVSALILSQSLLIAVLLIERSKRQRAAKDRRRSEERFRRFFELPLVGMAITSPDRRFLLVNQTLCDMFGRTEEELTVMQWVALTHPDDIDENVRLLNETLAGETEGYKMEKRFFRKNGQILYASISARCVRSEDGRVDHLVLIVEDTTQRRLAEDQLESLNVELEQRIAMRTQELAAKSQELETFAYAVAHDLKAPLRGVDGYSRLLLRNQLDALNEDGRAILYNVRSAVQQMNQMIDDLLAYSRFEGRALNVDYVDLTALIETIVAERKNALIDGRIDLHVKLGCSQVAVDADGLAQALRNLIDNAIKFSAGVERPEVEIGTENTGDSCRIWVRDNGIGFDMQFHDRIFEVFQRLHAAEEYAGTGIGLALVRKAVRRMGGEVWAESKRGEGATFYLDFPHGTNLQTQLSKEPMAGVIQTTNF